MPFSSVCTRAATVLIVCSLLQACMMSAPMPVTPGEQPGTEAMSADQLVQTDFNRTLTVAMRDNLSSVMTLLDKLYKRNPREWHKSGKNSHEEAVAGVQELIEGRTPPADIVGLRDIEILAVALDPDYQGDRVAALVYGIADTIIVSHAGKTRFYAFDLLNGQRVYNAARNVEAAAWLLRSRRDARGQPLLLANEMTDAHANLSFEREFGAIIGRLDLIADLLGENSRRLGINYAQNILFFAFLPVR